MTLQVELEALRRPLQLAAAYRFAGLEKVGGLGHALRAAVVRRNGTYFIKDLGSTNGIDFKGMRIDNKRIDEGDTFFICDYELKFTYQPQR